MRGAPQPQSRELSDAKAQREQDSGNKRKEGRTGETGLKMVEEEREGSSPEDRGETSTIGQEDLNLKEGESLGINWCLLT